MIFMLRLRYGQRPTEISAGGSVSRYYVLFCYVLYYLFAGMISIFMALESRRIEAGAWKINLMSVLFDIIITIICLINNNSERVMLDVFCFALSVSGFTHMGKSFRKSAMTHIQ